MRQSASAYSGMGPRIFDDRAIATGSRGLREKIRFRWIRRRLWLTAARRRPRVACPMRHVVVRDSRRPDCSHLAIAPVIVGNPTDNLALDRMSVSPRWMPAKVGLRVDRGGDHQERQIGHGCRVASAILVNPNHPCQRGHRTPVSVSDRHSQCRDWHDIPWARWRCGPGGLPFIPV
jgi:hypothetical protein